MAAANLGERLLAAVGGGMEDSRVHGFHTAAGLVEVRLSLAEPGGRSREGMAGRGKLAVHVGGLRQLAGGHFVPQPADFQLPFRQHAVEMMDDQRILRDDDGGGQARLIELDANAAAAVRGAELARAGERDLIRSVGNGHAGNHERDRLGIGRGGDVLLGRDMPRDEEQLAPLGLQHADLRAVVRRGYVFHQRPCGGPRLQE